MLPYRFNWFYKGEQVGRVELRIVETQDEAEAPDHCWCVSSRIFEHLELVGVEEGYPALLIRWLEIGDDFQNQGHGTEFVKFFEEFALQKNCVFCYCKLELNDIQDLELQRFYLERGWKLIEVGSQKRILQPDSEACYIMAYLTPRSNQNLNTEEYMAVSDIVPTWELEMKPKRYIIPD